MAGLPRADASGEHASAHLGGPSQTDEMDLSRMLEDIVTPGEAQMSQWREYDSTSES